ncbi:MAG: DegT/DnrJ/EryC1/StrS family aminotransferase, partial [Candidatus Diapherotrites archaeon]|nr:DegT/DnrJ/EryC1/StrS family aminotransferase [Candidatus Diapherotrites archaeon]
QAAMGFVQIDKLPQFVEARKSNFKKYYKAFEDFQDYFILPRAIEGADPCWFAFPITLNTSKFSRFDIQNFLEQNQIETRLVFAGNVSRQPAYKNSKMKIVGELKNSDKVMSDTFFIGVYPGLTDEKINYVLSKFEEFLKKHK